VYISFTQISELGVCKWSYSLEGSLKTLAVDHRHDKARVVAIGTGRVFDIFASIANAISFLRCEGYVHLLTSQGGTIFKECFDAMVTAVAFLDGNLGGQDKILVGNRRYWPAANRGSNASRSEWTC